MNTLQKSLLLLIFFTLSLFSTPTTETNTTTISPISTELKEAFKKKPSKLLQTISHKKFLKKFYKHNHYNTLWIEGETLNLKKTAILFNLIRNDITLTKQGTLSTTAQLLEKSLDNNVTHLALLQEELKLTSLYREFLRHTLYGEIKWKQFSYTLSYLKKSKINASWIRNKAPQKITTLLLQEDLNKTIEEITPKKFGYQRLLKALKILNQHKKNGGWDKLNKFKKIKLGSRGDSVLKLRKRLIQSGDYQICEEQNSTNINLTQKADSNNTIAILNIKKDSLFDNCLNTAVKKFQKRHGLVVDGVVGKGTQKVLNISVDEKIRKVLLNIDRIKWLPRDENKRYIVVNIPEFMLHYIEDGVNKQKLRVITGDRRHPTPIFSESISFVVLNPYWKVPEGIVKREVIPKMIENPNYLRKQGLEAHTSWHENSPVVDTSLIYWEDYLYEGTKFPYRLMQPPGPRNALGKIKFKFPNRFSVYLHDTPTRYLFKRTSRAFSHGCVRVSKPRKLLDTIASFNSNINLSKAKKILKGKRKKQLNLKEKLRIYLVYLTAGMDDEGNLQFRNDIYRYDKYQKRIVR